MAYTFGGSPLDSLINGLRASTNVADAGVGAAQSGVNAVLGGGGQIQHAISNMNAQAGNVIGQGNAVNQTAGEMREIYKQLGPIADLLGEYGDSLWDEGNYLYGQSHDALAQAAALIRMDPNTGGLSKEFIDYWNSLSPDRFVAQAASDTTDAFNNALGQAQRELSRRGISASSGAFGSLMGSFVRNMAVANAAAKTKAYQTGRDQQAAWLKDMTSAAGTLNSMGTQTEAQALQAQNAALNAQAQKAQTISAQGQGMANVGSLQSSAGQLFAAAASIYGNVGQLQNSYLQLINQAYGNLTSAQFNKADAYRNAVATEVSAVNGGGGGGGGGGVTQAPEDDWMNWRDTGHSQTWNKNDGFRLAREIGVI